MQTPKHSPLNPSGKRPEVVLRHELSEHLGWAAKQLLTQARPTLALDLAGLAAYRGRARR